MLLCVHSHSFDPCFCASLKEYLPEYPSPRIKYYRRPTFAYARLLQAIVRPCALLSALVFPRQVLSGAGLTVAVQDAERRRTLALYMAVRLAQCWYNSSKLKGSWPLLSAGIGPNHGDALLFTIAVSQASPQTSSEPLVPGLLAFHHQFRSWHDHLPISCYAHHLLFSDNLCSFQELQAASHYQSRATKLGL